LVEDGKVAMLDELGPCPHGGFCPGPGIDVCDENRDGPLWLDHGKEGMHERRRQLLVDGGTGMCFVDHLGFTEECLALRTCSRRRDGKDYWDDGCCDKRFDMCKKVKAIWDEEVKKVGPYADSPVSCKGSAVFGSDHVLY
jgi:hypothetical protein